jgi:hypothetical protein
MAMTIAYNSYVFPDSFIVPISSAYEFNDRGMETKRRNTIRVTSHIKAAGQSAINTAVIALEAAMTQGGTLALKMDGGSATIHTYTGCKVMGINYPEGQGAEYATRRTVEVTFEATTNIWAGVIAFTESIEYSGGGPRVAWIETIEGPPRKYTTAEQTLYIARVRGSATSRTKYPTVPAVIWPGTETAAVAITRSPAYNSDNQIEYTIGWSYECASATPLVGLPNTWL